MEYVDGIPIDTYCDENQLTTDDRVRLFRDVCAAVAFAHRDLKPGNILVTGDGVTKLLDFGIAKLLAPEDFPHTVHETSDAMRLMTPRYASPEQVRGETITVASDVYSLGAILYEILSGHPAHDLSDSSIYDLERIICESEPEPASQMVTRNLIKTDLVGGDRNTLTPDEISRRQGTRAEQLRRHLTGDLDTILLMALRKESERRYRSVDQFSDDLRRYLDELPVVAQKDTWRYRTRRFVRRNRVGVLTGNFFILILVVFGVAMTIQAFKLADGLRTQEHISDFLVDIFRSSSPNETAGEELTARELLDRGAERIDGLDESWGKPEKAREFTLDDVSP